MFIFVLDLFGKFNKQKINVLTKLECFGESRGLVVMGGDSRPKVMGSNSSTIYWIDILSHIFVVKICNVCLKRPKINKKEAGVGPFKKHLDAVELDFQLLR